MMISETIRRGKWKNSQSQEKKNCRNLYLSKEKKQIMKKKKTEKFEEKVYVDPSAPSDMQNYLKLVIL